MALSKNQNNLLIELNNSILNNSKTLEQLKSSSHIKSFDSSFNSLLHKGFVQHYNGNNDNSFLMTIKGSRKAKQLTIIS